MSVDTLDIMTCATFCDDRLRSLSVTRGRISRFPIDLRRRLYNTLALPCECVMGITLHYIDILAMCCRVISPSFYICSYSCVQYCTTGKTLGHMSAAGCYLGQEGYAISSVLYVSLCVCARLCVNKITGNTETMILYLRPVLHGCQQ